MKQIDKNKSLQIGIKVYGNIYFQVYDQIGIKVYGNVYDQVYDQVENQVRNHGIMLDETY